MKNRICSLLLIVAMLISGTVFAADAETTVAESDITPIASREYDALKSMGLLTDDFLDIDQNAVITRAQFVGALHKVAGLADTDKIIDTPFVDVSLDMPNGEAIAYFYNAGIVNGAGDNRFLPNDPITYVQAFKISADLLGYRGYVESVYGKELIAYVSMAKKLGLSDSMHTADFSRDLIAYDAVQLLLNCGMTLIPQEISYNSDGVATYKLYDDRYLLALNHKIFYGRGQVSSNGIVSLNGETANADEVVVGKNVYKTTGLEYIDLLGCNTKFLYKKINDRNTILWMAEDDNQNQVLDIPAAELLKDDGEYGYNKIVYKKSDRKLTANLYKYRKIVYNNKLLISPDLGKLKPETGSIRLVDNNGDKVYETVIINEFDNILIKSVSVEKNMLVTEHNTLQLEDYDTVRIEKNGEVIGLNEVTSLTLASYVESLEKDIIFIYINDKVATEKLESIGEKNGKPEYRFENGRYVFSHTISKRKSEGRTFPEMKTGDRYKFYLDMSGEIGAIESVELSPYTLLVGGETDEDTPFGDGTKAKLRMILSDGTDVVVSTARKVVINDGISTITGTGAKLLSVLREKGAGTIEEQVVKAYFNTNGELRGIDLAQTIEALAEKAAAENNQNDTSAYGYNKNVFSLDYSALKEIFAAKTLDQIGPKCRIDGNTICFIKYVEDGRDCYDTVPYQHFGDNVRFNVKAYDYDECFTAGAVIFDRADLGLSYKDQFYVVDEVVTMLDDETGEPYVLLTGYQNAGYQQYKMKPEVLESVEAKTGRTMVRGDVFKVALNFEDPEWIEGIDIDGGYYYSLSLSPLENKKNFSVLKHDKDLASNNRSKNANIFAPVYSINSKAIVVYQPNAELMIDKLIATPYKPVLGKKYLVYDARIDQLYYASNMEEIRPTNVIKPDGSMVIDEKSTVVYIRRYANSIDDFIVAIY